MGLSHAGIAGPLSGITVLDLTRVLAGPYCTMMLGDLGARVIKVESPGKGDDARQYGPMVNGHSTYFVSVNRGKQSIALDLKAAGDRETFERLLAVADVLVENFRPGVMEKLGYGWDALEQRFPRLIYGAISGFGHSGPYRNRPAYDVVVQAMGGLMSMTGYPDGLPTRVGTSIGDIGAGLFLAFGISSALYQRERTGKGAKIDVGMLDCQVALLENAVTRYAATGEIPQPLGTRHPFSTPFQAFRTGDGWIVIAAGNDRLFHVLTKALARDDLADNSLFHSVVERTRHHEALRVEIELTLATRTTQEWLDILEAAGVPCGRLNTVAEVVADPQIKARNMVCSVHSHDGSTFAVAGNPVKFPAFADPAVRPDSPALDQHRAMILAELGVSTRLEATKGSNSSSGSAPNSRHQDVQ